MVIALLGGSFGLFLWALLRAPIEIWDLLAVGILGLMVVHTWYIFGLLLFGQVRRRTYPEYAEERIAVLVPCFNEDWPLLERSLDSVADARGNKEIVIIDDGSTNGVGQSLVAWTEQHGATLYSLSQNRGKREALHHAVKRLSDDVQFVVTIDSDTVLDRNALVRIVEPLKVSGIAASTGDVRLLNERDNLLTHVVGAYYWVGLNIYKLAQSAIGSVVCCSGCLAAYRADVLIGLIDEFHAQRFLGRACTHSEDRHLTNLVLRGGGDVVYVPLAVAHTETPDRLGAFVRQQTRWKRGFIRESIYTLTHAWRHKRMLFAQVLLWDLPEPFLTFGLRLAVVGLLVTDPHFFLIAILPSWILVSAVRNVFLVVASPKRIPGLLGYMLLYESLLYWLNIWALFTVRNSGWLTRGAEGVEQRLQASSAVI